MTWVAIALASAVSLSLTDLCAKRALRRAPVRLVSWARLALPVPFLALAVAVWGWETPRPGFWGAFAAGIPLEITATLLYQRALQLSPLGLTSPYLAFTPAFLVFTGAWLLGELPGSPAYLGIALVTCGGYVVQLVPGMGPLGPLQALWRNRGSVYMLGVAAVYSVTAALGKIAVVHSNPQTAGLLYFGTLAVVLAPWALRSGGAGVRAQWAGLLPVGLFGAAMILCHLTAIRMAPASYMIAVKRTSVLWSILLGRVFLAEGHLGWRLTGGGLMVAGVAVLAGVS